MILGIGTDLCQISRIERAIEKPRFLERVFTPAERARIEAAAGARRGEIAAGTFAAKEAVAKALGTGFDGFFADAVEILPDAAGRPICTLSGGAFARAQALAQSPANDPQARAQAADDAPFRVWLSITHDSGLAAATAVLEAIGIRE